MVEREERLLTVGEAKDRLRVSRSAIYKWVADGRLPALRAGNLLRFRPADLERFLRAER